MSSKGRSRGAPGLTALLQMAVLTALAGWMFWPEIWWMARAATHDIEAAPTMAAPILALIMLWHRRHRIVASLDRGSAWGPVLIMLSLLVFTLSTYPWDFAMPRRAALVPLLAGCALTVGGWRVLRYSLPIFVLLAVAIPIGPRHYGKLIMLPEAHTLDAVRASLDMLPGVLVELRSTDLHYVSSSGRGTIALGEYHRGASLLLASLSIVLFISFLRIRPFWQLCVLVLLAGPIVMLCNYIRLMSWGLAAIYGSSDPTSPLPRIISIGVSLIAAYALTALAGGILSRLIRAGGAGTTLVPGAPRPA